jgi:acyl-CoA reductase-like NAD-dependent aldehyde dehydrogenase
VSATTETLTPLVLELGGKSAHLVFADADAKAAARHALSGLVVLSGQGCANGTRVLVEAPLYDELLELSVAQLRRVSVGDPLAATTALGPVVSEAACERILGYVERARGDGARLVAGGSRLDGALADGFFVAPTIFADVDNTAELAREEVFGPVLAFLRFEDEADAVRLANESAFGLAAYVHTNDLRRAHRVSASLEVGNVFVNGMHLAPSAPFGGTKGSGHGRVGGRAGVAEFLRPKNVWVAL